MKHIILSSFLFLATSLNLNAQSTKMSVGYVDGEVNTSGTDGFSSKSKDTWVSGAMYLPKEKLQLLTGNHIDSIHAGLASRLNVDSLRVWVRTSLSGEDLASGAISGRSGSNPRAAKDGTPSDLTNRTSSTERPRDCTLAIVITRRATPWPYL